jgi:hypothetical protein
VDAEHPEVDEVVQEEEQEAEEVVVELEEAQKS